MPARLTSDLSSSFARSISYLRSCEMSLAATETRSPMDWSVPLDGMRLTAGSAMWYLPASRRCQVKVLLMSKDNSKAHVLLGTAAMMAQRIHVRFAMYRSTAQYGAHQQ